ncbi:MAG TPA: hypothetical protein VI636_19405 [Candidatus Angelobacter sp.]
MRILRAVLWSATVFVLVAIPAISAVAEGGGPVPWEPTSSSSAAGK